MNEETLYIIKLDGDQHPIDSLARPLSLAVSEAKTRVGMGARRVNLFKLVQTHTFGPGRCISCDSPSVVELPTGQRELPL